MSVTALWRAAALCAAAACVLLVVRTPSRAGRTELLGGWPAQPPEIVYVPRAALRQQGLSVIYSPEAQTDMWIRIAEAIDKDAVNDPALPPVPDEIADEAGRAKAEQDLEREAQQSYSAGQQNDTPYGFFAPQTETLSYVLLPVQQ